MQLTADSARQTKPTKLSGTNQIQPTLFSDIAVGAPWSGDSGQGQVFIYLGNSNGLSAMPSQVIDSPLPSSRMAFGFTLSSGVDIDGNDYPGMF